MIGLIALFLVAGLQAPTGTGSIEGTVTIEGTTTPIPNINVTLSGFGGGVSALRATTDNSGRFSFKDLAPGSYYLASSGEGYVRPYKSADTKSITITSGGAANGDLTLTRTGSIKGRVSRRDGSPVAGTSVVASPTTYVGNQVWLGASTAFPLAGARTNAQGEYEILSVTPMEYYIIAGGGTYYPNAIHPSDGKAILVTTGTNVVADIEYEDVPRYKVSGKVAPELLVGTSQLTGLYLVHKDTRVRDDVPPNDIPSPSRVSTDVFQPDTNLATTFRNGMEFEIRDVRPGSYDLIAVMSGQAPERSAGSSYPYMGYATVDVLDRDIENAAVVVRPGVTVTANTQFFLRSIGTTPHTGSEVRFADPSESREGMRYSLRNVPPGRYAISIDGLPISDVRQNGQSIFDTGLVVGTTDPAPLDVVISHSPGSIRGLVLGENPGAAKYAWVSVVPSAPHRENLSLYRSVRADAQGRFNITGIVPGEYKIFTFDEVPYFAGTNPGFVSRYESFGLPISIKEGQNLTVDPIAIHVQ